jgi:hypothetical protein
MFCATFYPPPALLRRDKPAAYMLDNEKFEWKMASERDHTHKTGTCDKIKFRDKSIAFLFTAFKTHFVKFLSSRWNFFRGINILIAFWAFDCVWCFERHFTID